MSDRSPRGERPSFSTPELRRGRDQRRRWTAAHLIGVLIGTLLLATVGEIVAAETRLSPEHYPVESTVLSAAAEAPGIEESDPAEYETESVQVQADADGAMIGTTIVAPTTASPVPGVVLVHGAGPGERGGYLQLAEAFAQAGVAAAVYDKRSGSESGGGRDFEQLADDATAVLHTLSHHDGVDTQQVGLWGLSEGGRVIPHAASGDPDVAYLITVSAATHSPLRNGSWTVTESVLGEGGPLTAATAAVWVFGAPSGWTSETEPSSDLWTSVSQPTLIVYGAQDSVVPPREGAERIAAGLRAGGNHSWSVRFFGEAGHDISTGHPGYLATMTHWIENHADPTAAGAVGGPLPQQRFASADVSTPWWTGLSATAVTLLLFIAAAIAPLLLRRYTSNDAEAAAVFRTLRRATLTAGAAYGAMLIVAGMIVVLAYTRTGTGWMYHLSWVGVRGLALMALACAVAALVRLVTARVVCSGADRILLAVQSAAVTVLLLSLALWGVFSWTW